MDEVRTKTVSGVKFNMDELRRVDPIEMSHDELPTEGLFDINQMRKPKKSDTNLYRWFHISQIPASKQKCDKTNYSIKSEEEIYSKREVQIQMSKYEGPRYTSAEPDCKCTSISLAEGSPDNVDTVIDDLETEDSYCCTLSGQGRVDQGMKKLEQRRCSSIPAADGLESHRSSQQVVPQVVNPLVTDSKSSSGDTKEKGKDFIKRRNIYATEKDSRDSPELSLMQEQLHQLVAPTAENVNLIAESKAKKLVDPESVAADGGDCQADFTDLALKRPELLEQSRQMSGDSSCDKIPAQPFRKSDVQVLLHQQKACSVICTLCTSSAETENVQGQNCASIPVPQKQHNEELRTESLVIKNSKKEDFAEVQFLGNNIDKEGARNVTQASEQNSNQFAKLTVSAQLATPAESPVKMQAPEGSLKSQVNLETKPGIEVKVLHMQREKIGATNATLGSRRLKADGKEIFEQADERFGSSGEKMESNNSAEQTKAPTSHLIHSSSKPMKTRTTTEAENETGSLASEKQYLKEFSNDPVRKSAVFNYCQKMWSATSTAKGEKTPQVESASAEAFRGLKRLLEKKLDLNYAVLVWKDYYERKRRREAEIKQKLLQKQTASALALQQDSSDSHQLDAAPTDIPKRKSTAAKYGVSIQVKSSPLHSRKVIQCNAKYQNYHNGIAPNLSREKDSTSIASPKDIRDEDDSSDKCELDLYLGKKFIKKKGSGNSLAFSNCSITEDNNENRCSSPDSVGSDISLDFYTSLHKASLDMNKYSDNKALRQVRSGYRSSHGVMQSSLCDNNKTNPGELSRKSYGEDHGRENFESQVYSKVSTRSTRPGEEGLLSGILDNESPRVGRKSQRSAIGSYSKANPDLGDSRWMRKERLATDQVAEEIPRNSRSGSKPGDDSSSFSGTRKPVSSDYRLHSGRTDDQPAKDVKPFNVTGPSPSRKRSTGLVDLRITNSGAVEDVRHKVKSSGLSLQ
ncbi:uncharacterized protein LOC119974883 [Scyliorhinus canicula]|uniref:uncharacterized protein LOC119974883 n=1 Tax=Scyliorhinus canicula TaxID=7830 RepID=UPI0018F57344|nr:uncharacterized protein LOC119974883 [Scyliorhinus canicula]